MTVLEFWPRSPRLPMEGRLMRSRQPESLGEFVRRVRREAGLSCTDVERQSARYGPKIAASYVNRIENGLKTKPSADRLTALARGLGISETEIFAATQGKSIHEVDANEQRLLARFRELAPNRQEDVLRIVETFHGEDRAKAKGRRSAA